MSADAMVVPMGEVRLDGRLDRMDGTWTGTRVAGQIERGTIGDPRLPAYVPREEPVADVFWFETFMERLGLGRRSTQTRS